MIEITFTTKAKETFICECASFSYRLSAETEGWLVTGTIQFDSGVDPFIFKLASGTETELEVKIAYTRVEQNTLKKREILLKNVKIAPPINESVSSYNNSSILVNSVFEITSGEAVIYGVSF